MGPIVSIAFSDGSVKLYIAASPLNAVSWDPHSEFQLHREAKACTCVSWRELDPTLPPLLAVGSSGEGYGEIWMFREQLLRWEQVQQLKLPHDSNSMDDTDGNAITAVAWAPRLGRPYDLVAIAAGRRVTLWSLFGAVDALEIERIASLDHDHDVWQLGWNMLGNWLAASTEGGEVCMWRPDLAGEWLLLNKITGGGEVAMQ
jgi:WD40 repeat protein